METSLTSAKPGSKDQAMLDVYPPRISSDAEVESISQATGTEFAILPPQNASGNWSRLCAAPAGAHPPLACPGEPPLRAGMTATVTIDVGRQRHLGRHVPR